MVISQVQLSADLQCLQLFEKLGIIFGVFQWNTKNKSALRYYKFFIFLWTITNTSIKTYNFYGYLTNTIQKDLITKCTLGLGFILERCFYIVILLETVNERQHLHLILTKFKQIDELLLNKTGYQKINKWTILFLIVYHLIFISIVVFSFRYAPNLQYRVLLLLVLIHIYQVFCIVLNILQISESLSQRYANLNTYLGIITLENVGISERIKYNNAENFKKIYKSLYATVEIFNKGFGKFILYVLLSSFNYFLIELNITLLAKQNRWFNLLISHLLLMTLHTVSRLKISTHKPLIG